MSTQRERVVAMPFKASFTERVFARIPLSTGAAAALVTASAIAVFFLIESMTGRIGALLSGASPEDVGCYWLLGDYRISVIGFLLWGYTAAAFVYLRRVTGRNIAAIVQVADVTPVQGIVASSAWAHRIAGVAGMAICLAVAVDISERPVEFSWDYWILPHAVNWLWCFPFGWIGGRFLLSLVECGLLLGRSAPTQLVDILDDRLGRIFSDQATESAFFFVVFLGLLSVHFVDPGTGLVSLVTVTVLLAFGSGVAILPMLEFRKLMRPAKFGALEKVRAQINQHSRALLAASGTEAPDNSLGDLLLLEQRLERVSVWPLSLAGAPRLLLYMAVGLGSWLGAAFVERLLDGWLG